MAAAQSMSGVNQLMALDRVLIKQDTTFFKGNKYVVMTPDRKVFLYAKEETSFSNVLFGGKDRPFHIDIFDTRNHEVIRLRRPYTFGPDKMEVTVSGKLASVVRQEFTFLKPVINVNDAADRPVLRVKGPIGTTGECDFDVFTRNKTRIGVIRKKWGGMAREMFTQSDNFEIRFPLDLDVHFKAALIGTCFLIDFLYYEK